MLAGPILSLSRQRLMNVSKSLGIGPYTPGAACVYVCNHLNKLTILSYGFLTIVNLKYVFIFGVCMIICLYVQCLPSNVVLFSLPVWLAAIEVFGHMVNSMLLPPVFGMCTNMNFCWWLIICLAP